MINRNLIYNNCSSDETIKLFTDIMTQDKPIFFSRVGGSDYDVVANYYKNPNLFSNITFAKHCLQRVKDFNGYFDFNNDFNNFKKYLDDMIRYYKNNDGVTYCGQHIINQINNDCYTDYDKMFLDHILDDNKVLIDYSFIETIRPFLKSFETWGKNKKILIISPLSKSVEHQYKNRDNLYVDYKFPEFELLTYTTKVTYNNDSDSKTTLNIQSNNWHEECKRMSDEISEIDFDIAFLTCASYSMYLGDYIKNTMGKKSIYLGGILNVFFNIYGGRYSDDFYTSCGLNLDSQIDPFENDDIVSIKGGRNNGETESISAYFGKRIK